MVSLTSLWLPILLSAVAVFFISFITHMVLGYHQADYGKLPQEDNVMDALRKFDIPPGDYMMPNGGSTKAMKDPVFIEKFKKGPVALMTVMPAGQWSMGKSLVQWFIYCVIVGIFAAYIASRAMGPGQTFGNVMQFAGTVAFVGYSLSLWQDSIWYRRKWGTTLRNTFDGLLYGLATGAVFAVLWPGT